MLATFSTTKRSKWNYQTIMKISSMRSYRARTAIASQQCHHMWKQREKYRQTLASWRQTNAAHKNCKCKREGDDDDEALVSCKWIDEGTGEHTESRCLCFFLFTVYFCLFRLCTDPKKRYCIAVAFRREKQTENKTLLCACDLSSAAN